MSSSPFSSRQRAFSSSSKEAVMPSARTSRVSRSTVISAWGSFSVNDVSAAVSVFHKGTADDISKDPEVKALLERGDSSVDPAVRKEAYAKALALIAQRAYTVPLYTLPTYYVAAKEIAFTPYSDEIPRFWEMSYK